jgi:hypothetical protein
LATLEGRPLFLAATLLSLGVLVLQTGSSLSLPQFWAEDCLVFFSDAHSMGWGALLQPYAGYWHWAPRTVAQLADQVPLLHAPLVMVMADLLLRALALGTLALLVSPRPVAIILFACALLVPHSGELLGNVSSAQWHLAFVLIGILLMNHPPASRSGKLALLLMALLSALSSPLVTALAPLYALKLLLRDRSAAALSFGNGLLALLIAVAAVQLITAGVSYEYEATGPSRFTQLEILQRLVGRVLDPWNAILPRAGFYIVLAMALTSCLFDIRAQPPLRQSAGLFLGGALLAVMGIIAIKLLSNPRAILVPDGGDRYFWVIRVLLVACCMLALRPLSQTRPGSAVSLLLVLLVLGQWSSRTPLVKPELPDTDWPQKSQRADHLLGLHNVTVTRVNPGVRCLIMEPDFIHPNKAVGDHITP